MSPDAMVFANTNVRNEGRVNGYVGGLSNQASSSVGDVPGNRYNGSMEFDYFDKPAQPYDKESRFTFAAQHNDQSLTQYSVQEAYIVLPASEKNSFKVGRQILPWSAVDANWGFGKLNNRRNFDFFEPGQEGLVGLQFERKSANGMRYRAFYSSLYVPETNPSLDINKGDKSIKSRSPWGNPPASTTMYNGNEIPVLYTVDYPSLSEVVYRHSVGANVGFESKHWVMDNFIMRKPENQLSTKVDFKLNTIDDVVEVKVRPQFYYHDVYGSTLKWRNKDVEIYGSAIAIRPNTFPDGDAEAFKYTEIKTEKRREDYLGVGISKTNDLYGIGFNYVARLSPFDRQKEQLAEDPRWNQAVNVFSYYALTRKLTISGDVKYDMLTTDRLMKAKVAYSATRNFQLLAGVNSIGTPTDGKSYWATFTNNDSVYGALRYIF
ncbi:MAG: hypothetical protein V4598_11695 [Bdellovibrionota bacterium]